MWISPFFCLCSFGLLLLRSGINFTLRACFTNWPSFKGSGLCLHTPHRNPILGGFRQEAVEVSFQRVRSWSSSRRTYTLDKVTNKDNLMLSPLLWGVRSADLHYHHYEKTFSCQKLCRKGWPANVQNQRRRCSLIYCASSRKVIWLQQLSHD
jgi:hypothetical protein